MEPSSRQVEHLALMNITFHQLGLVEERVGWGAAEDLDGGDLGGEVWYAAKARRWRIGGGGRGGVCRVRPLLVSLYSLPMLHLSPHCNIHRIIQRLLRLLEPHTLLRITSKICLRRLLRLEQSPLCALLLLLCQSQRLRRHVHVRPAICSRLLLSHIIDPAVWMDLAYAAVRVHAVRVGGREETKVLCAAEQHVEIVVKVVVEAGGGGRVRMAQPKIDRLRHERAHQRRSKR